MSNKYPQSLILVLLLLGTQLMHAQAPQMLQSDAATPELVEAPSQTLSRGFDRITIGMGFDEVSDALIRNPGFEYRGLPDVSLSPDGHERIIETRGGRFISRAVFQFREEKLFSIILDFNPAQLDWYMLYTDFTRRFGEPDDFSPRIVWWEDPEVRLILEKPLTVKYLSVPVMNELASRARIERSLQEETRENFIRRL